MIFEEHHYGNPISEKLSQYLMDYTNKNDIANVSAKFPVSISTIRDVMYRRNNLTENNAPAMKELVKVAINNCTMRLNKAEKDIVELEKMIA